MTWQVWAAKKAHQPPLPCGQVFNQRLGEGHPDRKPRPAVVLGRMWSEPRERPSCLPCVCVASYQGKFQLRGPVWRYAIVSCMPETTTTTGNVLRKCSVIFIIWLSVKLLVYFVYYGTLSQYVLEQYIFFHIIVIIIYIFLSRHRS